MAETHEDLEEELRHRYLLSGIATGPAKPGDIDGVEQQFGIRLPVAYRAYLRVCGTHPPRSLVGSGCAIHQLSDINSWAKELIVENKLGSQFTDAYFVFLIHQGYTFLYFYLSEEDDPPVFCYLEGQSKAEQVSERFTHWVAGLY